MGDVWRDQWDEELGYMRSKTGEAKPWHFDLDQILAFVLASVYSSCTLARFSHSVFSSPKTRMLYCIHWVHNGPNMAAGLLLVNKWQFLCKIQSSKVEIWFLISRLQVERVREVLAEGEKSGPSKKVGRGVQMNKFRQLGTSVRIRACAVSKQYTHWLPICLRTNFQTSSRGAAARAAGMREPYPGHAVIPKRGRTEI